jgi:hypothetical protein
VSRQGRLKAAERWIENQPRVLMGMMRLQGQSQKEVLQAIRNALEPKSVPVLEKILLQAEKYAAKHGGKDRDYGFIEWLGFLQNGSAALPEAMPDRVMRFWRDKHAEQPTTIEPIAGVRCLRCAMVLPGVAAQPGWPLSGSWLRCPVCASADLAGRDWPHAGGRVWTKGKKRYIIRHGVAVPE